MSRQRTARDEGCFRAWNTAVRYAPTTAYASRGRKTGRLKYEFVEVGSRLVRVNEASLVLPTTLLGIQATERELPMRRHPRFPISDYTAIFIPRKTSQHPYHPETRGRRPFAPTLGQCFDQSSLLKDVSWNLDSTIVRKPARASAAMCHREKSSEIRLLCWPSSSKRPILSHPPSSNTYRSEIIPQYRTGTRHGAISPSLTMVSQYVQTDKWFHISHNAEQTETPLLPSSRPLSPNNGESEH